MYTIIRITTTAQIKLFILGTLHKCTTCHHHLQRYLVLCFKTFMSSAVNISNGRKLIESSSLWSPLRCLDRGKWWLGWAGLGWLGWLGWRRSESGSPTISISSVSPPPARPRDQRAIIGGGLRWAEVGWAGLGGTFPLSSVSVAGWWSVGQTGARGRSAAACSHHPALQLATAGPSHELLHHGPLELQTILSEV